MDKNSNAKQISKKTQMAVDKSKKSASKKKKKVKKSTSLKSDQSPDSLEVEGVRAFDQHGVDSDTSSTRPQTNTSLTPTTKSSVESRIESTKSRTLKSPSSVDNEQPIPKKTKPKKSTDETLCSAGLIKPANSTIVLDELNNLNKRSSVSFSNFDDIPTITSTLSNMSVKQKNGSKGNKTKNNSKSNTAGATSTKREKTKAEPIKSSINRAAEAAARIKSEESLRWEYALEDDEAELERIKIYKMNRRKRYLAAAQEKGLGWVVNYGTNGSPLIVEDSGTDFRERDLHMSVTDFSSMRSIMPSQSGTPLSALVN